MKQTFENKRDIPIYVHVEISPECYELEPGKELTVLWHGRDDASIGQIVVINDRELVFWPNEAIGAPDLQCLIDGVDVQHRNWVFKHR